MAVCDTVVAIIACLIAYRFWLFGTEGICEYGIMK